MEPPHPANESKRLAALRHYPPPDSRAARDFDDLTFLASLVCGTPIALITLVLEGRQCFKSNVGTGGLEASGNEAFCAHAILEPERLLIVRDALADPRFADSPLVRRDPHVRFYAAQPLVTSDGLALGALCVMDRIPRDLSAAQREALGALARQVEAQLELRGDVAELHVAEHALVETRELAETARAAAEQASQAKSFFLANMSHELRTPLNSIIGYSEMLQEEARDSGHEQYLADLEKIRVAGKHLLGTINDVLDLSKIEAGKTDLHVEPFDVDLMVRDVVGTIRPVVERNGNRLEISRESNLGAMRSDATKIRQCVINVLGNAGKFTEGGLVRLEVSRAAESGSDWLTFRVSDTGIGMTSAQVGGLFEPFIQADESTTRKYGGTGLGLALTRRYCRLMGGDISVRSEIGRGSTFTIHLPAEPAPVPSRTMAVAPFSVDKLSRSAEVHAGAPRVLLIDDDPDACELLSRLLMREGYQVACAPSGDQGLGLARTNHPAAIILDVVMPGMDGWATLAALKSDPATAGIPVIIVSMIDEPHRGFALGAADYLVKPIDRNRLMEVLDQYRRDQADLPVLVVEDDPAARELIRRTVASEGWPVTEAEDGVEALRAVAERRPALILLDLMMPRMDGFEFVTVLRQTESWRSIPIVVITAKEVTEEDRRSLDGCVQRILKKSPWSREELLSEVAGQIGRTRELNR